MKVHLIDGAKNTFALVSFLDIEVDSKLHINKNQLSSWAKKICHHPEVKVDGCVFVFNHLNFDFGWQFFNSDGSAASMCGNAARAVSFWYYKLRPNKKTIRFFTENQNIDAEILQSNDSLDFLSEGEVKVWLNQAKYLNQDRDHFIYDSGVPHLCVHLDANEQKNMDFEHVKLTRAKEAQSLRYPSALDHKGSNVTYVWFRSSQLMAISFERGVENWTEACGTGAIAAAYFAKDHLNIKFPIRVQMPGGILQVDEDQQRTSLTGPAKIYKVLDFEF